ncbi:pullulanase-type alpha-1,6-glucosidase [Pseudaeromonas pectinilytica]
MDFRFKKLAWYVMPSVVALALAGCGSDNNDTNTTYTPSNPAATLPTVTNLDSPTELYADDAVPADTLVLSLIDQKSIIGTVSTAATKAVDSSSPYATYSLYLWNNATCSALAETPTSEWADESRTPDSTDNYGASWDVKINPADTTGCINAIVRTPGIASQSSDIKLVISDRQQAVIKAGTVYDTRAAAFATLPDVSVGISGAAAHLIDANTIVWEGGKDAAYANLYYAAAGGIDAGDDNTLTFDKRFDLTPTSLTEAQLALLDAQDRQLKSWAAFSLPDGVDIKTLLKGELIAVSTDSKGVLDTGTKVQVAKALDAVYAEKAEALEYGAIVSDSGVTFRLWAPTAQDVKVVVYNADKTVAGTHDMAFDSASGSWSYTGAADLKGSYYRYQMTVYHPATRAVGNYEVTDPYSLSLSTNSEYSQIVDLDDAALKPDGWDSLEAPHSQATAADIADIVVHESHVRDLTAFDTGAKAEERGKYVALADENSLAVKHLKELSAAGVTHLQILPAFDIATINEDPTKVANLDDKFSKLCDVNSEVKNSTQFNANCSSDSTIAEVMATLDKDGEDRQALNRMVANTDSFNWGYDPFHYTTPEGSYATDAEGSQRILEFRKMVKAIKEDIGMNVVMDVVYNHTNEAGLGDKSVLDKVVPWYYQRLDETSGDVTTSTCCSNTAPEHAMFAKLMDDSLITWTKDYKIDSFRFDIMGHHPKAQMVEALAKVKAVAPEMYFYGEGWNFGEVADDARFEQARQANLGGTGIGSFSDRLRDAVRGGSPFDGGDGIRSSQGFGNGAYVLANEKEGVTEDSARHLAELTMLGMAGNLKDFVLVDREGVPTKGSDVDYNGQEAGYANDPIEIQNYVSKHDNQTIFDIIAYKAAEDATLEDRVRMQGLSLATVMLGQGTAFDQQGTELLRSKSFERDSYDSGDWYNKVDYTKQDNNYDVGLPRKDKDGDNYALIKAVKDVAGKPGATEIAQMDSFYKELASLRKSSPLFTLGTGTEVMKRVDFRNVGPDQITGLIAMTIDDGTAVSDMDSTVDGIVVIVNATDSTQTVGDFKDGNSSAIALTGYEQSSIQTALGTASIGNGASFADGQFSVPAWSVAVFVKPQGSAQGTGLPVSEKQDPSTIEPFDVSVYLRGGLVGDWGATEANQFTFTGANYSYEFTTDVTEDMFGSKEVKVADADWSAVNYGVCTAGDKLVVGTPLTLCSGDAAKGNVALDVAKVGTYHFVFRVVDKDSPTLTLAIDEPAAACELLADSTETATLGDTKLALRGNHSSWNWDAAYQLTYKGSGIYEAKVSGVDLSGGFKIAADTDSWDPQFFATSGGKLVAPMAADTVYEAYGRFGGEGSDPGNNTMSLGDGNWLFRLKLDTSAEMSGAGVKGTIDVCQLP